MNYFPFVIGAVVVAVISLILLIFIKAVYIAITLAIVLLLMCLLWYIRYIRNKCKPLNPDRPRLYCGKENQVPEGYIRRGEPYECLRIGIGVGRCSRER
jgi:hypothetical protein